MSLMKIVPDEKTYNYLIRAASHEGNHQIAEDYLAQAQESTIIAILEFGESKYFYTSLMQVYAGKREPEMAYKILQEMTERGI